MVLPSAEIVPINGFSGLLGSGTVIVFPTMVPSMGASPRPVIVTLPSAPASKVTVSPVSLLVHGLSPSPPESSPDQAASLGTSEPAPLLHV